MSVRRAIAILLTLVLSLGTAACGTVWHDRVLVPDLAPAVGQAPTTRTKIAAQPRTMTTRIATFNLYGCSEYGFKTPAGWGSCTERVPQQWRYLQSQRVSLAAFQEVEAQPYDLLALQARASGWGIFPTSPTFTYFQTTAITWSTRDWQFLAGTTFPYPKYQQRSGALLPEYGTAVQLRNRPTGRTVWVMSVHNASTSSTDPAHFQSVLRQDLAVEAGRYASYAQSGPVLVLGDFNDGSNLTACAFAGAASGTIASWGYPHGCGPQVATGEAFDKIFVHGAAFTSVVMDWSTQSAHLSDHGVPIGTIGISGTGTPAD